MALDVFHLHNRIVHQDTDHQRECQQCHHIGGKAHVVHANKRGNGRQWQCHRRHQRGAPAAQEEPHHNHGQHGTFVEHGHRRVELFLHRCHKVKGLGQFQIGVGGFQVGQCFLYRCAHFHFTGAFAAGDLKAHHRLAVQRGKAALLGYRVLDGGNLIQAHTLAAGQAQLQAGQLFHRGHCSQGAHGLFGATQVSAAARALGLHQFELARDVGCCGTQALQLDRVQRHLHFAGDTAHASHRAHAPHAQ